MDKHVCKQCGKVFRYCSACSFKTIYYHEEGFCSDKCCTEYRLGLTNKEINPVVIEEPVIPIEEYIISSEELNSKVSPLSKVTSLQFFKKRDSE